MDDFNFDEPLDDVVFEETFAESQQKSVKKFCDGLNPRNVKDKPFVALCKIFKRFGIDGNEIAEGLVDNPYMQFLNPEYVAYVKIYEEEGGRIDKFVNTHNLDMADFIRYTIINKNYL